MLYQPCTRYILNSVSCSMLAISSTSWYVCEFTIYNCWFFITLVFHHGCSFIHVCYSVWNAIQSGRFSYTLIVIIVLLLIVCWVSVASTVCVLLEFLLFLRELDISWISNISTNMYFIVTYHATLNFTQLLNAVRVHNIYVYIFRENVEFV